SSEASTSKVNVGPSKRDKKKGKTEASKPVNGKRTRSTRCLTLESDDLQEEEDVDMTTAQIQRKPVAQKSVDKEKSDDVDECYVDEDDGAVEEDGDDIDAEHDENGQEELESETRERGEDDQDRPSVPERDDPIGHLMF
uniref:Histone H2A.Z-specific chaperone CHZ1-like n=1 Tax=Nicotiana tabacum TaxID=4097 RepID=A0A1S3XE77_TOBAC